MKIVDIKATTVALPLEERFAVARTPHRHGVPVLCAVSAYERFRQSRLWPQDQRRRQVGDRPPPRRGRQDAGPRSYLDRRPSQLSGGQRQRVAIGRAMVREPQVFLFDEPLSNLDAKLRNQTRIDIKRLQRQLGATAIFVTHGQVEAMTLADKIVVLQDGVVAQIGTPLEVFERPRNQFVAGFMGAPSMNFIDGAVGPGAFPLLVLRNSFSGISREVDEAARSKGPVNGGSSSQ